MIAEAGVNHLGRFDYARALIEGAKAAGADIIKFQTYKADRLTTPNAPRFWDWQGEKISEGSQYDSYSLLDAFGAKEYAKLKEICDEVGIEFMSTPFDFESVDILEGLGVGGYKVASCDLTNRPLLEKIAKLGKPILLSTGGSDLEEVKRAVGWVEQTGNENILIMHCTLTYPTPVEDSNLLAIEQLKSTFSRYLVGHSDHTLGIDVAASGTILGSSALEKHFTFDKSLPLSADHWLSLDVEELSSLVSRIRILERARGAGDKVVLPSEQLARANARRSVVAGRKILKGESFTLENLDFKRPGTGIPPYQVGSMIGGIATREIQRDELIELTDFHIPS